MTASFALPEFEKRAFTCPHCNAYAAMDWDKLYTANSQPRPVSSAICFHCKNISIWMRTSGSNSFMVYPSASIAPLANPDLPSDCMQDYMEARSTVSKSPRAAAALLRLCVQRLVVHLGCKGQNINEDIATLVEKGLPVRIQQALDFVRVVGNNAVHPGTMALEDNPQTALALFGLVNMIVDNQITQPKHVEALFGTLPERALEAIAKRDSQ